MSNTEDTIQRIFEEALPSLVQTEAGDLSQNVPGTKQLIKALFGLYAKTSEGLASGAGSVEFSKMWLIRGVAHELLQNSIEDAYVDMREGREEIFTALRELYEHGPWLEDPRLHSLLSACRAVANKTPIPDIRVEIELDDAIHAIARVAPEGKPPFQVSTKSFNLVPILEDSIAHPAYVREVVSGYAEHLWALREQFGITALCFVEKDIGPVGALSMTSMLANELKLPATIYRMKRWSSRSKLAGYLPGPSDRIAIIYDLLVTGDALQHVARDLSQRFGSTASAAVVLFGYEGKREHIPLEDEAGNILHVRALGWYDSRIRSEAEEIRVAHSQKTEHLRRLDQDETVTSASWNGKEGIDSIKEDTMSDQPIELEQLPYGDMEEDLDIILTGIQRFEGADLAELLPAFQVYEPTLSMVRSEQDWELRQRFDKAAKLLYRQKNEHAIASIRDRIEHVSVEILERETRTPPK